MEKTEREKSAICNLICFYTYDAPLDNSLLTLMCAKRLRDKFQMKVLLISLNNINPLGFSSELNDEHMRKLLYRWNIGENLEYEDLISRYYGIDYIRSPFENWVVVEDGYDLITDILKRFADDKGWDYILLDIGNNFSGVNSEVMKQCRLKILTEWKNRGLEYIDEADGLVCFDFDELYKDDEFNKAYKEEKLLDKFFVQDINKSVRFNNGSINIDGFSGAICNDVDLICQWICREQLEEGKGNIKQHTI
ncbi:hypothetical protein SAMN02910327_01510 [Peptostreptococcaceae bacterium pGA-8]|nr:hypothetical protein SAMN02910327_01510 [Peptostreptococcaceae bacterium pGA-8]